jgi:phosphoesterase RecJ-like protein
MTVRGQSLKELAAAIHRASSVIVLSHYNPDADAYGSSCGLALGLQSLGKTVRCLNENGLLPRYEFIPGVRAVEAAWPAGDWDLCITCDCGDRGRIGESFRDKVVAFPRLINIDHHASNDLFGHLNYVVDGASSTSEIIFELLTELGVEISPDMATCLFAGIAADTGSFRYSSTAARTFAVAESLVRAGAAPAKVSQALYGSDSLALVKLHADAMMRMELLAGGRISLIAVTQAMFATHGALPEDADPLVERGRDIVGVEVAVLLKQDPELWRVSLRSKRPAVDVSAVAQAFGGGGHKMAAGFRWRRDVDELRPLLLAKLEDALRAG